MEDLSVRAWYLSLAAHAEAGCGHVTGDIESGSNHLLTTYRNGSAT